MIKYRGLVEKEIAGKKVSFKFNMAAFEAIGDDLNLGLSAMLITMGSGKLSALSTFLYRGAMQYCKQEKKQPDFTREDATEWLGELGFETVVKLVEACLDSPKHEEKNVAATSNSDLKTHSDLQSSNVALVPEIITN